jgi:hypothetical protein
MEFGTRSIRSAGQGSGSVEVTLPAAFRGLAGLPCRLALRDGLRPEIVLQPELRPARTAFATLWQVLDAALELQAGAEPPLAEFLLSLWPATEFDVGAPRLAWADGLALAGAAPHAAAPVTRSMAALAQHAAGPLGIAPELRAGFGAACGFALTGLVPGPAAQAACDIAAALLRGHGLAPGEALTAGDDDIRASAFRGAAMPMLARLAEAHLDWTAEPERHAGLLAAWRRGVTLELGGA